MSVASSLTPDQSEQIIYNTLRSNGLNDQISKIITAQSGHETNGWTSNIYLSDNNGFGFGYSGGGDYYAFNSVEDGVSAVVGWLASKVAAGSFPDLNTITDPAVYAQALKDNGYYADSEANYAAGIERWVDNNLTYTTAGIGVAAIVGIVLLVFLLKK